VSEGTKKGSRAGKSSVSRTRVKEMVEGKKLWEDSKKTFGEAPLATIKSVGDDKTSPKGKS